MRPSAPSINYHIHSSGVCNALIFEKNRIL
jgi:hypothetical protein